MSEDDLTSLYTDAVYYRLRNKGYTPFEADAIMNKLVQDTVLPPKRKQDQIIEEPVDDPAILVPIDEHRRKVVDLVQVDEKTMNALLKKKKFDFY